MNNLKTRGLMSVICIAVLVVLDQFTKQLAVKHLMNQKPFVIIENVFQLQYLENRGAAFGMLKDQRIIFYLCALVITGVCIYVLFKMPAEKKYLPLALCCIFILAGAYGNLLDRIVNNYVVDFFYFKLIDFPIFNVADIYVTCAAFFLIVLVLFVYKEEDIDRISH